MLQIDGPYMMLLQLERARRGDPPASSAMLYVSLEAEASISSSLLLHCAAGQHQNEGYVLGFRVFAVSYHLILRSEIAPLADHFCILYLTGCKQGHSCSS